AGAAEIGKLLDLKITIPIRIDVVRIALIAADDHVAQDFDGVVGNNPNVFQANGTGKSYRCAGDLLDDAGSCEFKISDSQESLNLDRVRLMVSPDQHDDRVFSCRVEERLYEARRRDVQEFR